MSDADPSWPPVDVAILDHVHEELTVLLGPEGDLHERPAGVSFSEGDLVRLAITYRDNGRPGANAGAAALVTAGPPGAGKSTQVGAGYDDYRRIDPDEIKDLLLAEAAARGALDHLGAITLGDGQPVLPREVSGWFHHESTRIATLALGASLAHRENVLIEGTLQWFPLAEEYAGSLLDNDYEHLRIVDVEVPLDVALRQVRGRWWRGRAEDPRGGRFLTDAAVTSYYIDPHTSRCVATADDLWERTWEGMDVTAQRYERAVVDPSRFVISERSSRDGVVTGNTFVR